MKRGNVLLLALAIVLGLFAAGAGSMMHDGMSARAQPSALEAAIAGVVRRMAMPGAMKNTRSPVANSPEALRDGMLHFADHCTICHGNDGSGDTMMGHGMYPKPPDLRAEETQKKTDGEIFWIIENGVRLTGMPGFGGEHSDAADSWKLVQFIRHLPALTAEERVEMEKYNPKGPGDRKEEQEEQDFLNGAPAKTASQPEHHHH